MTIKSELVKLIKTSDDPDKLLKLLKPKKKFNEDSKIGKEVNRVFRQVQQELKGWVPPPPKLQTDTRAQRPFTKQQQEDLPLRQQLFNEDGVRIRDLIGKPPIKIVKQEQEVLQEVPQEVPQVPKVQLPLTKEQLKELPLRQQLFNEDGVRIRDLVGKPSVIETKEIMYSAIANLEEKLEDDEPEVEIGLLESVWNYMKEIGFVDYFSNSIEKTKDIAIYIASEIQNERMNEDEQELDADQLEKESALEETEVPEIDSPVTQNEINKLLGINVSPAEVTEMKLEVQNEIQNEIPEIIKGPEVQEVQEVQELVNKTVDIPEAESQFSAWGVVGAVSDGLKALFQWLKDHESNYDTPLPFISIIPEAQFVERGPDPLQGLEPLPEVTRDVERFTDRQMLLDQRRAMLTFNRLNEELDEIPGPPIDEIFGNGKPQRLESRVKIIKDYHTRKLNYMRK